MQIINGSPYCRLVCIYEQQRQRGRNSLAEDSKSSEPDQGKIGPQIGFTTTLPTQQKCNQFHRRENENLYAIYLRVEHYIFNDYQGIGNSQN
jgi:hypothetical protein